MVNGVAALCTNCYSRSEQWPATHGNMFSKDKNGSWTLDHVSWILDPTLTLVI
jgi:hypothetical protein